jgi:hypothetical protein
MLSATALADFRELQPSKTEEALIIMVQNYTYTILHVAIQNLIVMNSGIIYRIFI